MLAQDLIKQLLQQDPERRLGNLAGSAADVKAHPFFANVDWDALLSSACPSLLHSVTTCMVGTLAALQKIWHCGRGNSLIQTACGVLPASAVKPVYCHRYENKPTERAICILAGRVQPPIVPMVLAAGDATNFGRYTESVDMEVPGAAGAYAASDVDAAFQAWLGQLPASPGSAGHSSKGAARGMPPASSFSLLLPAAGSSVPAKRASQAEGAAAGAQQPMSYLRDAVVKPGLAASSSMSSMASTATLESLERTLSGISMETSRQPRLSSIDEGP